LITFCDKDFTSTLVGKKILPVVITSAERVTERLSIMPETVSLFQYRSESEIS
jgi:hypothetical protein